MTDKVFIDTSAWLAAAAKNEPFHQEVSTQLKHYIKHHDHLFTSDYVLDECYTRIITHQSYYHANKFKQYIEAAQKKGLLLILFTDSSIFNKTWAYFKKYQEHQLSFTDATIITHLKTYKLTHIMTLDQGFKNAGFPTTPKLPTKKP